MQTSRTNYYQGFKTVIGKTITLYSQAKKLATPQITQKKCGATALPSGFIAIVVEYGTDCIRVIS